MTNSVAIFSFSLMFIVKSALSDENCFTPRSEPGQCIVLTNCPSILNILKNRPISVEDAEYLKRASCGFEGLNSKVCCPLPRERIITEPPVIVENDLLPNVSVCGAVNQDRIIGGTIADIGDYPWMALIEYQTRTGRGFYCGGVLINNKYVLTAAHCVKGKDLPSTWKLVSVRLGEYNTSASIDCIEVNKRTTCAPEPIDVPVVEQIAHEEYNPQSLDQYHDIALLRLASPVQYTDFIRPICLPVSELHARSSFDNKVLEVAGWGKTETKSASDVKLKLMVHVRTNTECGSVYKVARITLGEGQMCAGGVKGQDSCRGDSGGPLMAGLSDIENNLNYYVLGVVSFGPTPCGMEGWPGVYTRVTKYGPWIKSKLLP